ncbi:MAG: hypothetical protein QGG42_07200 [Phycisphaerae bacterium]|jgi:hypothetical protein|nr:hypothetical protein [Phycisphaerae bacterium]
METIHVLLRRLSITAALIALALLSGGCFRSDDDQRGGLTLTPSGTIRDRSDTWDLMPPVPPDSGGGETPRPDAWPTGRLTIVGDWWNEKGTHPQLRFHLSRGWYYGALLSVNKQAHERGFRTGQIAYRVQRVSRWIYEGQVLSRYNDGREPDWKRQFRFNISSENPSVMVGYGQYGRTIGRSTYTRRTR